MPLVLAKSFFKLPYLAEPCWCWHLTGGILTFDLSVFLSRTLKLGAEQLHPLLDFLLIEVSCGLFVL